MIELLALDNHSGPYRFTPKQAETIIESALDGWLPARPHARRLELRKMLLLAAAAFALSSAAAAFFLATRLTERPESANPSNQRLPLTEKNAATPASSSPVNDVLPTQSQSSPAIRTRSETSVSATAVSAPRDLVKTTANAEDPLRLANRLRQQQKWRQAEQTYRRVSATYPGSTSAYVALVAAAAIRLEHLDDSAGALDLYRLAISANPDGVLDLEARFGIARCWRTRGETERESEALSALLQRYPAGPVAARARNRLERIGETKP